MNSLIFMPLSLQFKWCLKTWLKILSTKGGNIGGPNIINAMSIVQNDQSLLYFQLFLIHQSLLQCLVINNAWDKDHTSHPADLVWTCLSQLYNYPSNLDFGMTILLQLGRNFHFPDSLKVIMCAANFYFLLLTF